MKKNNEKMKLQYLPDSTLYMLWKYLNSHRLTRKKLLGFEDIKPAGLKIDTATVFFILELKKLGLKFEKATFHKDLYFKYQENLCIDYVNNIYHKSTHHKGGYEYLKRLVKKNPDSKTSKSFLYILGNKFSLDDIENISLLFLKAGMTEFFEFSTILSKNDSKKLNNFLSLYIGKFIKNKLQLEKENHYRFEIQKKITFDELKNDIKSYGNNFIFTHGPKSYIAYSTNVLAIRDDDKYLFIHSLVALEKLGYLKIEEIYVSDRDLSPEKGTDDYKIKITINKKYFRKKNNTKINTKIKKGDEIISQKVKFIEGILNFRNKEISFNSKPNQKDLLNILFKNSEKNWYYDEIYEEWGEGDFIEDGWRKLYNAGDGINQAIAIETGIKDFIIKNTKQIQINPKYI